MGSFNSSKWNQAQIIYETDITLSRTNQVHIPITFDANINHILIRSNWFFLQLTRSKILRLHVSWEVYMDLIVIME